MNLSQNFHLDKLWTRKRGQLRQLTAETQDFSGKGYALVEIFVKKEKEIHIENVSTLIIKSKPLENSVEVIMSASTLAHTRTSQRAFGLPSWKRS